MLVEVYNKIMFFLGPSPSASQGSPNPNVPLASSQILVPPPMFGGEKTGQGSLSPSLADVVVKIDGKIKVRGAQQYTLRMRSRHSYWARDYIAQKMLSQLSKELDNVARNAIKDELSCLDPLLDASSWAAEPPQPMGTPEIF